VVDDKHVPIPVNIDTVNALFDLQINSTEEMDQWLRSEQIPFENPNNSEEMALSRVGDRLYNKIFKPYTIKQWGKLPNELGPEVLARIPVRNNHDDRYFSDEYQALPSHGYTAIFEEMLRHPNIVIRLNTDYFLVKDTLKCGRTYFTGPIDAYYAYLGWEKLEYRSLDFERRVVHNIGVFQPSSVVNHPSESEPFTRIVEYKHFLNQQSPHTVLFYEYSKSGGEPYYPVPNLKNKALYAKYQQLAAEETSIIFVGRLANYKYFDMDQTIMNALELFDKDRVFFPMLQTEESNVESQVVDYPESVLNTLHSLPLTLRSDTLLKMKKIIIVISHCDQSLHWVTDISSDFKELISKVVVFTKCGQEVVGAPSGAQIIVLPNIGREGHTYAHWLNNYFPIEPHTTFVKEEIIVFLRDSSHKVDHASKHRFGDMLSLAVLNGFGWLRTEIGVPSLVFNYAELREFKFATKTSIRSSGRPDYGANIPFHNDEYSNLGDWVDKLQISSINSNKNLVTGCFGGYFAVSSTQVSKQPKSVWKVIEESLSRGDNIVEGHYAERLWGCLLSKPFSDETADAIWRMNPSFEIELWSIRGMLKNKN
jgi:UDP-galactopyranose mutase